MPSTRCLAPSYRRSPSFTVDSLTCTRVSVVYRRLCASVRLRESSSIRQRLLHTSGDPKSPPAFQPHRSTRTTAPRRDPSPIPDRPLGPAGGSCADCSRGRVRRGPAGRRNGLPSQRREGRRSKRGTRAHGAGGGGEGGEASSLMESEDTGAGGYRTRLAPSAAAEGKVPSHGEQIRQGCVPSRQEQRRLSRYWRAGEGGRPGGRGASGAREKKALGGPFEIRE